MAATFVTGKVVRRNRTNFLDTDLVNYGVMMPLPTPGAGGDPTDGDYWAKPITDHGVVDGFDFIPYNPNEDAPSAQSFRVFRLIVQPGRANQNSWYVVGTVAEYIAAAATAETSGGGVTLPTTDVPPIAPEFHVCAGDTATFAVPSGDTVSAYGYFNGAALPDLSGAGYADGAALAAAMQATWGATVGGTFTFADGVIKLVLTDPEVEADIAISTFGIEASS